MYTIWDESPATIASSGRAPAMISAFGGQVAWRAGLLREQVQEGTRHGGRVSRETHGRGEVLVALRR